MILRNNLASVPVKNYSLFLLGCFALVLITVLLTVYNVATLSRGYFQSRELQKAILGEQARMKDLQKTATELNSGIARISTPQFIAETEFMNHAIKQRVFSWTTLFNRLEEALPDNVRMLSVTPVIAGDTISISLQLQARSLQDMVEFIRVFENNPAFADVVLRGERHSVEGYMNFSVTLRYFPPGVKAAGKEEGR